MARWRNPPPGRGARTRDPAPVSDAPAPSPDAAGERQSLGPGVVALIGLLLAVDAALADSALASRHFGLALVYVPPLLALAWIAGWRFAAACTLLAAAINLGIDVWLGSSLPNPALVHVAIIALFAVCLPLECGVSTLRFMLEYTRRGDAWKASIHPARLAERVLLVPVWPRDEAALLPAQPTDVQVLLDPGQDFGVGSHPTTIMCVALLEKFVKQGGRILDLGCGSGILSLPALKLSAGSALAADIQSEAAQATLANIKLNDLASRIEVRLGSLEAVVAPLLERGTPVLDITLVNILPDVIVSGLKAGLARTLAPDGVLIVSGLRTEHETRMRSYLAEAGLQVVERRQMEEWLALASKRITV
jgi:ribosomal protein L11 methyltransferase